MPSAASAWRAWRRAARAAQGLRGTSSRSAAGAMLAGLVLVTGGLAAGGDPGPWPASAPGIGLRLAAVAGVRGGGAVGPRSAARRADPSSSPRFGWPIDRGEAACWSRTARASISAAYRDPRHGRDGSGSTSSRSDGLVLTAHGLAAVRIPRRRRDAWPPSLPAGTGRGVVIARAHAPRACGARATRCRG